MSGPAVAIGYILLIPSILGILVSVLMLFLTGAAGSRVASDARESAAAKLRETQVPEP